MTTHRSSGRSVARLVLWTVVAATLLISLAMSSSLRFASLSVLAPAPAGTSVATHY